MRPINFLAIEDDDVDVMSIERAFKDLKLVNPLNRAVDGKQGWELISQSNPSDINFPHIILLDLNMPRMNGLEFLAKFFSMEPRPDCSIFVLTTSNSDKDIVDAYKYEIAGYILKDDLVEGLREAIEGLETHWALMA